MANARILVPITELASLAGLTSTPTQVDRAYLVAQNALPQTISGLPLETYWVGNANFDDTSHTTTGVAPIIIGALSDTAVITGSGTVTLDASAIFSGTPINYSLTSGATGVSIDTVTGIITIDRAVIVVGTYSIVVQAANAYGSVTDTFILSVATPAAFQSINANGWSATYTAPPTFDPVNSPVTASVTRIGNDSSGNQITVGDTVTLMKRLRNPYSAGGAQNTLTPDQVVLSEFVYAGDVVTGVTNNSTLVYPKPTGLWLTPDYEVATGSLFVAKLAVSHAYARNGRAVAAVRFIATDGTNTAQQTVSTQTYETLASGLTVPYFRCSLDTSGLNQANCTLDAIIYPWVGYPFQLSIDASTYPSINLTTITFYNDKTGAYGRAYAYVDSTLGNNGTGVVSTTPATAEASPYLTIASAAAAIRTFNNANFGRNNASNGVIRLEVGQHNHSSFSSVTVGEACLTIEAADPASRSSTIWTENGVNIQNSIPNKLKVKDITLKKIGASVTFLDNSATISNMSRLLVLDNVNIDLNGTSSYGAWIYRTGRAFFMNVTGGTLGGLFDNFGGVARHINAIGCYGSWGGNDIYNMAGSRLQGSYVKIGATGNREGAVGQLFIHSFIRQPTNGQGAFSTTNQITDRGLHLVGTIFEQTGGTTSPLLSLNADSNVSTVENLVVMGCTGVGSRLNVLYQDIGVATVSKRGFLKNNVFRSRNTKTDVFGTNANLIGNWPTAFNVGSRSNTSLRGAEDGSPPVGVGKWLGELAALGDVTGSGGSPLNPLWTLDASFDGTAAGFGDYSPAANSTISRIPAGFAPYPVDQKGRLVPNDGTAFAGALMTAPPPPALVGSMSDISVSTGVGVQIIPTASFFSGASLSYSIAPAVTGWTINSSTGVITVDLASILPGASTVNVIAGSIYGTSVTQSFVATVGSIPALNGTAPAVNVPQGTGTQTFSVAPYFTGASLVYALTAGATGFTINTSTGVITADRTTVVLGTYTFTTTASNGFGPTVTQTFSVTVSSSVFAAAQTAIFGMLTPSGAIGYKPLSNINTELDLTGTPTLTSGSAGAYTATIVSGRLTFSGATGAPDGSVWRCNVVGGGTVDLTVAAPATTITIGSDTEFTAAGTLINATKTALTIVMRYLSTNYNTRSVLDGRTATRSGYVTVTSEKPTLQSKCNGFLIGNSSTTDGLTHGKIIFDNIGFYKNLGSSSMKTNLMPNSSAALIQTATNNALVDVIIRNNYFTHFAPIARLTGNRPNNNEAAIYVRRGDTFVIEDNYFEYVAKSITMSGTNSTIRRNVHRYYWDDPVQIVAENNPSVIANTIVQDVIAYDCIGDHGYHPDVLHCYQFASNGTRGIDNLKIHGCIFFPGYEGVRGVGQPVNPTVGTNFNFPPTTFSGTVLDVTGALSNRYYILDPVNNAVTVTLQDSTAAVADFAVLFRAWATVPGNPITISANGQTLTDSDLGGSITTLTLDLAYYGGTIRYFKGSNTWSYTRMGATYQYAFSNNADLGIKNVHMAYCIGWLNSCAMSFTGGLDTGNIAEANSFVPPYPNTGLPGQSGYNPGLPNINLFMTPGSGGKATGNIVGSLTNVTNANGNSADNLLYSELNFYTSFAAVNSAFTVGNPAVSEHNPLTPADAILMIRPKAGGTIPSGFGAVGTNSGLDHYEHFNGTNKNTCGLKNNRPSAPLRLRVSKIAGGIYARWFEPAYRRNATTSYLAEYRINGGSWVDMAVGALTRAVLTTATVGQSIEFRVTGINANGNGITATWPSAIVVTNLVAPALPVLNKLFTDPYAVNATTFTSRSFTYTGGHPLLVVLNMRLSAGVGGTGLVGPTVTMTTSLSDTVVAGVGASISSALRPAISLHSIPTPSSSAQTIGVTLSQQATWLALTVYEVVNGDETLFGAVNVTRPTTGTASTQSLETTGVNSTVIVVYTTDGTPTVTHTSVDTLPTATNTVIGGMRIAHATQDAATINTYSNTFTSSTSVASVGVMMELMGAVV